MNTFAGFSDAEIIAATAPVRPPELLGAGSSVSESSVAEARQVFARAAWSGIVEPGDRVAGMLWTALGPESALEALISDEATAHVASRVGEVLGNATSDTPEGLAEVITEAFARWRPRLSATEARAHLARAAHLGAAFVVPGDHTWPTQLDDLGAHGPAGLWTRGHVDALAATRKSISVVGARASTGYGEHVTMEIVTGLCDRGYAIVSGAAYGIDGMAHRATLASEATTVAVLAGGVDRLYPSGHDTLLNRIIETGSVVSELPCGWAPTRWRFLQRNRLIAALGQATAVMEAGWRSGSLNTAHHALSLERPVGAVPGPITSASSAGCHRLLRETPAVCVTSADEVLQLVSIGQSEGLVSSGTPKDACDDLAEIHPFASRVVDAMSGRSARTPERVARESGLSREHTIAILGLLQMSGLIHERATGWIRKK